MYNMFSNMKENTAHMHSEINSASSSGQPRETRYDSFIRHLPLFSGVDEETIGRIQSSSNIRASARGQILFHEHEPSTRLYLVLDGWVKVFKGNAAGEEAILQMAGKGEFVELESVFLGVPFPAAAQTVEDAVLLSMPAPVIRELVRATPQLAVNMVTCMSQRSNTLIHQMESIRLKPAQERVGWFLLKLLLEQGQKTPQIRLPYDKAMIASYLDMTPETFSRILKQFRNHGFAIDNHEISLPHVTSLCAFCDEETMNRCHRKEKEGCPDDAGSGHLETEE